MNNLSEHKLLSRSLQNESGVALVLTVFVVSLATLLVVEFGSTAYYDQRIARNFSESVQGNYSLKSAANFAALVLEIPKPEGEERVDALSHPWNQIGRIQSEGTQGLLELPDLIGDVRAVIEDENSKIDINSILDNRPESPPRPPREGQNDQLTADQFWKTTLNSIMKTKGFYQESFEESEFKTIGNQSFDSNVQVGAIQDWIDPDSKAYNKYDYTGLESGGNSEWFYNRRFKSLNELLLVPGMTANRLSRLAPFIRVSSGGVGAKLNINTIHPDLLEAMSADIIMNDLISSRESTPITQDALITTLRDSEYRILIPYLQALSSEFSLIAKAELPSSTRWIKATFQVNPGSRRVARLISTQIF